MPKPTSIAELRSLVTAWTPAPAARPGPGIATGVPSLDAALGGGLPRGRLTELVSATPGSGGELVFGALLASTRSARLRVALVDAADGFVPANFRADDLRHLVWVRPRSLAEAMNCTDVLVRDGNYAVLVLDVRGVSVRTLRQQPSTGWHRLRLATEQNSAAVLVQSASGLVPAVPWRLSLSRPAELRELRQTRAERVAALTVERVRGQIPREEELAG